MWNFRKWIGKRDEDEFFFGYALRASLTHKLFWIITMSEHLFFSYDQVFARIALQKTRIIVKSPLLIIIHLLFKQSERARWHRFSPRFSFGHRRNVLARKCRFGEEAIYS